MRLLPDLFVFLTLLSLIATSRYIWSSEPMKTRICWLTALIAVLLFLFHSLSTGSFFDLVEAFVENIF